MPQKIEPIQAPKGMKDILPQEQKYWDYVLAIFRKLVENYGYQRIEVPILEQTDLFVQAVGSQTDIVKKEMFNLRTKGKDKLSLRPEYTAGIARAYIEQGMQIWPQPVKLYYFGPLFRYERPQAGRYRQFWQMGYENIGHQDPVLDAQIIQMTWRIFEEIGLTNLTIQVNSLGCSVCRPDYRDLLVDYYKGKKMRLCPDCKERLEKNPLRLLDCKELSCQRIALAAPQSVDNLCEECHDHFKMVLEYLDELDLPYILNPRLVRGLDYYTKTVFEIWPEQEGQQKALGGGGHYDDLIEILGGKSTPGLGWSGGIERIISQIQKQNILVPERDKPQVFLVQIGELSKKKSLKLFDQLQQSGINTKECFSRATLKGQLKVADQSGVKLTLIFGQKEALEQKIIIRDMKTGVQEVVSLNRVVEEIRKRLQ